MKSVYKKGLSTVAVALLLGVQMATVMPSVFAQEAEGLGNNEGPRITLSPPVMELEVAPGGAISKEVIVKNRGSQALNLNTKIEDFYYDNEGALQFISKDEVASDPEVAKFSVRDWLTLEGEKTINGFERRTFKLNIAVPSDASPGGHYGMVFFTPEIHNTRTAAGARIESTGAVGMMVLLTVSGDVKPTGEVLNNAISTGHYDGEAKSFSEGSVFWGSGFLQNGPVDMRFTAYNPSSTHFKPIGVFTIYNMFGSEVAEVPINSSRIFPGKTREMITRYENDFFVGKYRGVLTFADPSGQNQTIEFGFWGLPIYWIILIIVLAGGGYTGLKAWARRMAKRMR